MVLPNPTNAMYKIFTLLVTCLLSIQNIKAGDITNFKIEFPKTIDTKNVLIMFDDGLEQKIIDVSFENNITTIKRNLTATYGTIGIMYPGKNNSFHSLRLLINSQSGYVIF